MWYYCYPKTDDLTQLPFYIVSIGQHELQPAVAKPQGHPYDQFFYGATGSGKLEIYGKRINLPAGSAFFVPAGVPHQSYPDGDVWDLRWVSCSGEGLMALYRLIGLEGGRVYPLETTIFLDAIMKRMHRELLYDKEKGNYFASSYLHEFIMEFARQCGMIIPGKEAVEQENVYEKNMSVLRDYIDYHFMTHISVQDLCDLIKVSPQHLCRVFKECTGKRPTEYMNMVRIENAKKLLLSSEHSIETIALWCGFDNFNYFCKTFKKQENMTAKEYRLQNQS